MFTGLGAGITWGIETFILGLALAKSPFCTTEEALFLAPFISTFLHDTFSALWMFLYNLILGKIKDVWAVFKTKYGIRIMLGAFVGGPVGMSAYVLCIKYLGVSIGAIATSIYPAVGAVFAHIFLKEKMQWYRWIFLLLSIVGVALIGYSPDMAAGNFIAGIIAALVYSLAMSTENLIVKDALDQTGMSGNILLQIRQISSFIFTGVILLTILGAWPLTVGILTANPDNVLLIIAAAAFFGTISYMLFAAALAKIGVAKSLALNGTYCVWAMILEVVVLGNTALINPLTISAAFLVVVFGILTAADFHELIPEKS